MFYTGYDSGNLYQICTHLYYGLYCACNFCYFAHQRSQCGSALSRERLSAIEHELAVTMIDGLTCTFFITVGGKCKVQKGKLCCKYFMT